MPGPSAPDEPIPISALQHYAFCPRQCALIHVEGLWAENRLTIEGTIGHRRVHNDHPGPRGGGRVESRPGVRVVRGLDLCSARLGLVGNADVVEFYPDAPEQGQRRPPLPVEHKRGRPKRHDADLVQVCAQAMCLEDMLGLEAGSIPDARIFYARTRRRIQVPLNDALRRRTLEVIAATREHIRSGVTPRARREPNPPFMAK